MKAIKIILGGLFSIIVVLAAVGFFLPDTAHVERTIVINASQQKTFDTLNSFKRFNEWSPWHARDPQTKYTFSGPDAGVGAKMTWSSDHPEVGSGSQEIIKVEGQRLIQVQLDFGAEGDAVAYYDLKPSGSSTQVTWGFDTEFKGNIIGRYFGLMFEGMLGPDYEAGLAKLKTVLEK